MLKRVLKYLWPYRLPFIVALAEVFVMSGCELLKPWPLKVIIDNVLNGKPVRWHFARGFPHSTLLILATGSLVVIYIVLGGITLLNNYTTIKIGQKMVNDMRRDLYAHLQRLSLAFHNRRQVGDLLYRVTSDTYAIQSLTMNGVFPILTALVLLGGMFAVMVKIDWELTILSLAVCPVLLASIVVMSRRITSASVLARQEESEVYTVVQRAMSAIRIIQAFTKEEEEHRKFMSASDKSLGASLKLYTLQTFYSGVVNVVMAVGTAMVVWVGAMHVMSGRLTVGGIIVFTTYLASLYSPINTICTTWGMVQGAKVGVDRVFEILEVEKDLKEGPRSFGKSGTRGKVTLENVCFHYSAHQPVLKDINLSVKPGEKIAFVGPTGVGKSTLVSLIPRFYDAMEGRVLIDDVDVRDFKLKSLRAQISMVLQPPLVFPISVRENIAYGRPEAGIEEIISAAKLARIHDSIDRLPEKYDTVVGEQGATLSEGERQRITIARAILRDSPILILDEPTSSVDAETEALIMEGLEQLTLGRTTFIIAHRLSTVRKADRIIVLGKGEIIEQGSFNELIRAQGPFAALYQYQFSEQ
ncbi:MAG: ABC transporter ATP-binding protein/permease [Deltaproteobacteria bacterium]|jgi:ATP-binding cassette subfamily B protein/subfamily B ATP-binding cassette protein MsbA|nr:ABC transporter ATP-binding protein/permease [Deltaproteobacteria bacterium]MDA8306579.1 ABC transporter ATP-binding protein [Deltaproteobacteria bacterium]